MRGKDSPTDNRIAVTTHTDVLCISSEGDKDPVIFARAVSRLSLGRWVLLRLAEISLVLPKLGLGEAAACFVPLGIAAFEEMATTGKGFYPSIASTSFPTNRRTPVK